MGQKGSKMMNNKSYVRADSTGVQKVWFMEVDGKKMKEEKVISKDQATGKIKKDHTRSIDLRVLHTVIEEKDSKLVMQARASNMTDDEVARFQEEWDLLWKPSQDEYSIAEYLYQIWHENYQGSLSNYWLF